MQPLAVLFYPLVAGSYAPSSGPKTANLPANRIPVPTGRLSPPCDVHPCTAFTETHISAPARNCRHRESWKVRVSSGSDDGQPGQVNRHRKATLVRTRRYIASPEWMPSFRRAITSVYLRVHPCTPFAETGVCPSQKLVYAPAPSCSQPSGVVERTVWRFWQLFVILDRFLPAK
jgi:hypothetical protein